MPQPKLIICLPAAQNYKVIAICFALCGKWCLSFAPAACCIKSMACCLCLELCLLFVDVSGTCVYSVCFVATCFAVRCKTKNGHKSRAMENRASSGNSLYMIGSMLELHTVKDNCNYPIQAKRTTRALQV